MTDTLKAEYAELFHAVLRFLMWKIPMHKDDDFWTTTDLQAIELTEKFASSPARLLCYDLMKAVLYELSRVDESIAAA